MKQTVGESMGIKASGGIRDYKFAKDLIDAGATRIGASSGIKILKEVQLNPSMYVGYIHLGKLYADTGRKDKAVETLREAKAAFQEMGMDYYLRRTQEVLEKVEAG